MFFLLSSAAGVALFAADEENGRLEEEEAQTSGTQYHDDPI
jgi:hypothetical protein